MKRKILKYGILGLFTVGILLTMFAAPLGKGLAEIWASAMNIVVWGESAWQAMYVQPRLAIRLLGLSINGTAALLAHAYIIKYW